MAIKQEKDVANIPSSELDDWGPVPEPVSEQISQLRGIIIYDITDGTEAAICEFSLGISPRLLMVTEIRTIVIRRD